MDQKSEWLNNHIDRMRTDKAVTSFGSTGTYVPEPSDVALLEMAALLTAARPRAAEPDPAFLSRLRERVLASID